MTRTLLFALLALATSVVFGVMACSFTSLDYLQNGSTDPGDVTTMEPADGGSTNPITPIVMNQSAPAFLVADDTSLYWTTDTNVMTSLKDGTNPRQIGPLSMPPEGMTVDSDPQGSVYVSAGTSVLKFPKAGAATGTTMFDADGGEPPLDLGVVGSSLFVLQYDSTSSGDSAIVRVPVAGGASEQLAIVANYEPVTLNVDESSLLWIATSSDGSGQSAFFDAPAAEPAAMPPNQLSLGAGDPVPSDSQSIILTTDTIYWTDTSGIYSRSRSAPAARSITVFGGGTDNAGNSLTLSAIVFDGTNFYAFDGTSGYVIRISLGDTSSNVITTGLINATAIAVDQQFVYVAVEGTGTNGFIGRIAK